MVGGGGREHALVWKLAQSPSADRIFCAPGNAGSETVAENIPLAPADVDGLVRFARENRIDLTVIGPDDALAEGIVDRFKAEELRVFGPRRTAAQLEASKIFAKELMMEAAIPTASARAFFSSNEALRFCDTLTFPVVIKADGLALGKGVTVAENREAACEAIREMMEQDRFGAAGRRILIEELLTGSECSVHALVSGNHFRMLATARDHKRVLDGDRGPNTGGMGAVSPADTWSAVCQNELETRILSPLLASLKKRSIRYHGLLFPGLMITKNGLRVLEFNCRFGDPETQAILPRLRSDLVPLLDATIDGDLRKVSIEMDPRPAVTVIVASGGYPGKYNVGKVVSGLDRMINRRDIYVFHAGTKRENGAIVTAGGRVFAVTAVADTVDQARSRAYGAVAEIDFEGCYFRSDIAQPLLPRTE